MGGKLDCLGCIKELSGFASKNTMQNDEITEFQVNISNGNEEFEQTTKEAFSYFEFHENLKRTESFNVISVKTIKTTKMIRKKKRCCSLKQVPNRIYSSNISDESVNICHSYKLYDKYTFNDS